MADTYAKRFHHRCHACGGSGYQRGSSQPGLPPRDCLTCKGNGVSHATFANEFVPEGEETDILLPDNRPLREVAIGNRRR